MKKYVLVLLMFFICNTKLQGQTYCYSGNSVDFVGSKDITDIKIYNDQNQLIFWNPSPCGSTNTMPGSAISEYTNYTNLSIPFNRGKTYKIVHTGDGCVFITGAPFKLAVYCDYNKNGSFFDVGDLLYVSNSFTTNPLGVDSGFFTIPYSVSVDSTRFRVVMRSITSVTPFPPPCGSFIVGETEDYTATFCDPYSRQLAVQHVVCKGGATGMIKVNDSGGRLPISYRFNNQSWGAVDSISGLSAGLHTIAIRDSVGCTYYDTVVVQEPAQPLLLLHPALAPSCYIDSPLRVGFSANNSVGTKSFYVNDTLITNHIWFSTQYPFYPKRNYKLSIINQSGCRVDSIIQIDTLTLKKGLLTIDSLTCHRGIKGRITYSRLNSNDFDMFFSINSLSPSASITLPNIDEGTYIVRSHQSRSGYSDCKISDTVKLVRPPRIIDSFALKPYRCYANDTATVDLFFKDTQARRFVWKRQNKMKNVWEAWEYLGDTANHMKADGYVGWMDVLVTEPQSGCQDSMRFQFDNNIPAPIQDFKYLPIKGPLSCQDRDTLLPTVLKILNFKSPVRYDFYYDMLNSVNINKTFYSDTIFDLTFKGHHNGYHIIATDSLGCKLDFAFEFFKKNNVKNSFIQYVDYPSCYNNYYGYFSVVATGFFPLRLVINDTITYWDSISTHSRTFGIKQKFVDSFKVSIIDSIGCRWDSFFVMDKTPLNLLNATVSVTHVSCASGTDGQIRITPPTNGKPPYSYSIDSVNYQTGLVFNNLAAGSYFVYINDSNNCPTRFNVEIKAPKSLKVFINKNDIACYGTKSGSATISASEGRAPYQIIWNGQAPKSMPQFFSNLDSGRYTFRVTDSSNCFIDSQVFIQTSPLRQFSFVLDSITCHQAENGRIQLSNLGGAGGFRFRSSNSNFTNNFIFNNLKPGSHTFYSIDASGCLDSLSIQLENPAPLKVQLELKNDVSCFGRNDGSLLVSYQGPHPPLDFRWNDNSLLLERTNLSAGLYTAYLKNAKNCIDSLPVKIEEADSFYIQLIALDTVACFGDSSGSIQIKTVGGAPPIQLLWSNGQTSPMISSLKGTQFYQIKAKDLFGCEINEQYFMPENPSLQADISTKNITCHNGEDGEIQVFARGGTPFYQYQLDGASWKSGALFRKLSSGAHTIQIKDQKQCVWDSTLTLFAPPKPILSLPDTHFVVIGTPLELIPEISNYNYPSPSYQWLPSQAVSCNLCLQTQFQSYQSQKLLFKYIYASNQCVDSVFTHIITTQSQKERVYIPNSFAPNHSLESNRTFRIFGHLIASISLQVYNRWGEKVFETQQLQEGWDGNYKGEPSAAGVYTYSVRIRYLDQSIEIKKGDVVLIR